MNCARTRKTHVTDRAKRSLITGIPGPTFPDGTPMFRQAFYGGL